MMRNSLGNVWGVTLQKCFNCSVIQRKAHRVTPCFFVMFRFA